MLGMFPGEDDARLLGVNGMLWKVILGEVGGMLWAGFGRFAGWR
jgi:hypothetical protein